MGQEQAWLGYPVLNLALSDNVSASRRHLNVVDCSSVIGFGVHVRIYLCIHLMHLQSPRQEDLGLEG